MTRDQQTILQTPARRMPYPPAPMRGGAQPGEDVTRHDTFARDTQDWNQERNTQRLLEHLDQRSNSSGGVDAVRAMAAGETLTFTSLGSGTQVRVPHRLQRVPSALVWFSGPDPNYRVVGVPQGQGGGFATSPWTVREVYVNTNAPAGVSFSIVIG